MPQSYTPEFRKKIVRLHTEEGRTYKSITAEYGCELPELFKPNHLCEQKKLKIAHISAVFLAEVWVFCYCELPEILNLKASGLSSLTALYSGKVCSTFSEKGALLFRKGCTFASEYSLIL